MDNKLLRFFDEIKLESEYYSYFTDSKIKKVEVNVKNKTWVIHISFKDLISTDMFEILCNKCKNIKDVEKVKFQFEFQNNKDLLKDYFWYYFNKLVQKCPMLEGIKNNNIEINENLIKIETLKSIFR